MHTYKEEETGTLASRHAKLLVGWGVAGDKYWERRIVTGKCGKGLEEKEGERKEVMLRAAGRVCFPMLCYFWREALAGLLALRCGKAVGDHLWVFLLFMHACIRIFVQQLFSEPASVE